MQIGQWDRFETAVTNTRVYANPFEDVTLNAAFHTLDGRTLSFYGFYDGNRTWKLRFMPDQPGDWTYEAAFSDGAPGLSGTFECVPSNIPGLIYQDESNPIWFGYRGGRPLLVRSFHTGDCFFADTDNTVTGQTWNPDMRTAFLDWAQAQGYNMLSIASHYLNRRSEGRGEGWLTPDLWDNGPRPDEYHRLETILDDLARRRMLVYPFAGFFGRDAAALTEPGEQESYIRYTLARFAPYWNLLFMVGGPEPHMKSNPYLSHDDINRLGRRIRNLDPFGHLISVHNPTGDDDFGDQDWASYAILQGPKTVDRLKLGEDHLRNHPPEKPLYAQETLWPGNILHSRRIGHDYSHDDIRKNAFVMLFSGAAINFADMDGLSSSGFSGCPDLALKNQPVHDIVKHVWDTFETFPFHTLRPRQDLVDTGHSLASEDLHRILVYLESPGTVNVALDGAYRAEWIDPQRPTRRQDGGLTGGRDLQTPDGGEDWLLDLIHVGDEIADQVHLSWSQNPSDSLTVTWHTASDRAPTTVSYRPTGGNIWRETAGETFASPATGVLHRVVLSGLSPDTGYDYRISSGPTYRTRTAFDDPSDFTFAFICDTGLIGRLDGNTTGTRQIIDEVLRDRPLFILGGGDYAYGNKDGRFEQMGDAIDTWFLQWQDVLAQYPFMAQYGNHEIYLKETYHDWAPRFAHPDGFDQNRNYSFKVGDVHITSLFLPGKNLTEEQLAWLDADLEAARKQNTRWLVVFQHESIYGHGTSHPTRPENRAALAPIFEAHGVDLHLSCHDQNYERTFPLTGVPDNPTPGSTDLHRYRQGQGVIYAKISPGGKMSEIGNQFSQFTTPQQPFMAVRDCTAHHYALVHVRDDLQLDTFSVTGDGTPKTLLDRFAISPPG